MGVVCRPVLLHNEYVSAIIGRRKYEYLVLGHHDGMTIEEAFPIEESNSFEKVFSLNAKYEGQLSQYATQFFYGFHENAVEESSFWASKSPFTFVSFVQFEDKDINQYRKYLESPQYKKDEKETLRISEPLENFKVIAYYTLDSNDIILVIKCFQCSTGTQIINNLHQNVNARHPFSIINSYSILAINSDYIEDDRKCASLEENIEWLECRIITRKNGSINDLYHVLRENLQKSNQKVMVERKGLMGTEDEIIQIQNVRWKELLPFYKNGEGMLMNSNRISQQYASAITTKIHCPIMENREKGTQEMNTLETPTPFCDYLYHKIEMIYKNRYTESDLTERKNLVMLVNALRKVEYSNSVGKNFNDYCFYTIMMPTAMFIRLRERDDKNAVEFYEFIKYVKLCMQNYAKSDRVYQQITDFNIRYFDIPSKLAALYNAYLYYAKRALNIGTKGEYEFLLCPGMNWKTEVKELYRGTDGYSDAGDYPEEIQSHHLFRVEIPEFHSYNPKLMLFVLGHEVSHFVGRVIRKRDDRYNVILSLASRMTAICLRERIGYTREFAPICFEKDVWDAVEDKISGWLKFHVEGNMDKKYMESSEYGSQHVSGDRIKKQINYYKIFYRHTSTLEILLNRAVNKTLQFKGNEMFDELIWKDINEAIQSGKIVYGDSKQYYEEQKRQIAKCIDYLTEAKIKDTMDFTIANGIKSIMYLLEECYADMICILLLRLPLKDYLGHLVKILQTIGYEVNDVRDTIVISRIAIVMVAMSYEIEGFEKAKGYFFWEDSEILAEEESEIFELQEEAQQYAYAYIRNQVSLKLGEFAETSDIQGVNLDSKMLKEIIKYLLKCRRAYYQNIIKKEEENTRKFYELVNMVGSVDFYEKTTLILKEYEQDIYKEMQKLKESEEGNYEKR